MSEKIVVPVLGESITEATVSKWLKSEGESVEADEPIVELETDKVNLEVPSPISGVLTEINSKDGTVVEVGALLGSVSENGSGAVKKEIIKKNLNNCVFRKSGKTKKRTQFIPCYRRWCWNHSWSRYLCFDRYCSFKCW